MPTTFTMPKLSPTMDVGLVVKWHKNEGDFVNAGDLLLEIATDKATIEHSALDEGWLRKIIVHEGEEAFVNDPIAIFTDAENEGIGEMPRPAVKKEQKKEAFQESSAPPTPQLREGFAPSTPLEGYTFPFPGEEFGEKLKASPLAKKLAQEKGLDLSSIAGSGPSGRVVAKDLEKAQKIGTASFTRKIPSTPPGSFHEEKFSPAQKVVALRLSQSKTFIPHFYATMDVRAEAIQQMRTQLESIGVKVTVNDFMIKAVALALREHPHVNSGYHGPNQTIIRFETIDVAVAVDTKLGLITPIIRHADCKNMGEIGAEMRNLAQKARGGKLMPEEYQGGSFTVSNLGMFGVKEFQAIINPPQAAILAVGVIRQEPIVQGGEVKVGALMSLTLSCDHRVVDGALAAKFLQSVKGFCENPATLLLY